MPPETVKINLHISTQGLEMMGLRKAWMLNSELAAMARLTKREEFNKRLEDAKKKGGLEAFLRRTRRAVSARTVRTEMRRNEWSEASSASDGAMRDRIFTEDP